jgi:adenylate cyclase
MILCNSPPFGKRLQIETTITKIPSSAKHAATVGAQMTVFPFNSAADANALSNRRLAAVVFVDIVGYSVLMAQDETRTHARWMTLLNEIIRPRAGRYHGKVVKSTGDGVLAEFPSALDAVEWSLDLQKRIQAEITREAGTLAPIALRIAVHLGDVMTTEDDIYGDGVNIAARLLEYAEPGGIVLSEAVYDLVRGTLRSPVRDLGLLQLKNFENPVRAHAVDPETRIPPVQIRSRAGAFPSIAVLPLKNLSGDPSDDYFAEGIVEDIVTSLSGLHELLVISRTSTMAYAGRQVDIRDVGRALGVRYVMTGSVRRSPRLVRVSVQLGDALSGASLWGDTSEVPPGGELFDVQDRIVWQIVGGIAPHVRSAELQRAMRKRPESFTAYDCTLRALAIINSLNVSTFAEALQFLEKAMAEDPNFAMAAAWAARWHSLNIGQGWSSNRSGDNARAAEFARRAVELDRQNAMALATYGHLLSFLFHDYDSALMHFERALAASPNSALALMLSAGTLSYVGRGAEAVRNAEQALRLSPFDQCIAYFYNFLGLAHYANGSYDEAVKWTKMSAAENPRYTANLRYLTAALSALDRLDEARDVAASLLSCDPGFSLSRFEKTLQPFRVPEIGARYVEHLRRAGLPP